MRRHLSTYPFAVRTTVPTNHQTCPLTCHDGKKPRCRYRKYEADNIHDNLIDRGGTTSKLRIGDALEGKKR